MIVLFTLNILCFLTKITDPSLTYVSIVYLFDSSQTVPPSPSTMTTPVPATIHAASNKCVPCESTFPNVGWAPASIKTIVDSSTAVRTALASATHYSTSLIAETMQLLASTPQV